MKPPPMTGSGKTSNWQRMKDKVFQETLAQNEYENFQKRKKIIDAYHLLVLTGSFANNFSSRRKRMREEGEQREEPMTRKRGLRKGGKGGGGGDGGGKLIKS